MGRNFREFDGDIWIILKRHWGNWDLSDNGRAAGQIRKVSRLPEKFAPRTKKFWGGQKSYKPTKKLKTYKKVRETYKKVQNFRNLQKSYRNVRKRTSSSCVGEGLASLRRRLNVCLIKHKIIDKYC